MSGCPSMSFPPNNCPFAWGIWPHLHSSLGPPESITVQPFLHSSRQSAPILNNGPPFPSQNCPFQWRHLHPTPYMISWAIRANNANGISIGSAVFVQLSTECRYTLQCPFSQNCTFPWGDLDPHIIVVSWVHPSPRFKRHLDRFSRFCMAY